MISGKHKIEVMVIDCSKFMLAHIEKLVFTKWGLSPVKTISLLFIGRGCARESKRYVRINRTGKDCIIDFRN